MIGDTHNPFDVFGLPPTAGLEEITEALQEHMERAAPDERERLRASWERLLRHPRDRAILALGAHPQGALVPPVPPPAAPDIAAIAAVAAYQTPADELLPLPLASTAPPRPPPSDPVAVDPGDPT
jgi:hypothetical protein